MHHATGLARDEVIDLCVLANPAERDPGARKWPPVPGPFKPVVVTPACMRHNRAQAGTGESSGVSQPTISRAIKVMAPLTAEDLADHVPAAGELGAGTQYVVDGTLPPCWPRAAHPELCPGRRKTTGTKAQAARTICGQLAWISGPVNGSRHDNHGLSESGVLLALDPKNWAGDKGYAGDDMITPSKKPAGGELLDRREEFNTQASKIRWIIGQVISHFKNWRVMNTDYRRPVDTFAMTISAVIGLHFYRMT